MAEQIIDTLSNSAISLWAKTGGRDNPQLWGLLVTHMADAGETARLLWRNWVDRSTKHFVCAKCDLDEAQAEALLVFVASVHDIGKATPSFISKVPFLMELAEATGLRFAKEAKPLSHAYMGEVIVKRWLESLAWPDALAEGLAAIIGGHHGANPNGEELHDASFQTRLNPLAAMGDDAWFAVQDELLAWAREKSKAGRIRQLLLEHPIPPYVQILFTGIVIMADWISSNTDLFPLEQSFAGWNASRDRAATAWELLKLPQPIALDDIGADDNALFRKRFTNLPSNAKLRPMQKDALDYVRTLHQPELIIIEALMGDGKTEAALLCAEVLARRFGCGGLAFLLPTQATSNAMFSRVESWLQQVLQHQGTHQKQDIRLLHGKAALNEDFSSLPAWGIGWMGDSVSEQEPVIVHQWLSGAKRGLLAKFVIGTVDQLLMASLRAKHVHLRHLGLSGKVVIIDEVHAYDAYMSLYLDRVLSFLGAYGVPVILLSATLPPSRRSELLEAYRGRAKRRFGRSRRSDTSPRLSSGDPAYPLISATSGSMAAKTEYGPLREPSSFRTVRLDYLDDSSEQLVAALDVALRDGGCVCVLRNTVRRAQDTYRLLCERYGDDVVLAHSRFIAVDRAARDARLGRLLGRSQAERPQRLVLVGTQVLEQSLDIDLDLLVTDIAPVDLLLQRMGRLHRHMRGEDQSLRPPLLRKARCLITGVIDWTAEVPKFAKGMTAVYEQAILLRTIAALDHRITDKCELRLPKDIAPLVECVYEDQVVIPEEWLRVYEDAVRHERETKRRKENSASQWLLAKPRRCSLDDWMQNKVSYSNEGRGRMAVRDTEDSLEVVVVQECERGYEVLPWVAEQYGVDPQLGYGADVPNDDTARVTALCTVNLPLPLSGPQYAEEILRFLSREFPCTGWDESKWLRGQIPLALDANGEVVIRCLDKEYRLKYSRSIGLEIV